MKWIAYGIVAYVVFVVTALNAIPAIVHHTAQNYVTYYDPTRRYAAEVYLERRVPFGPGGTGRNFPGYVRLTDRYGNNLGEKQLDEVLTVTDFQWTAGALQFTYAKNKVVYETTMELPP